MTKFALAVVAIAFGALMVAGCPSANNANTNKANGNTNTPTNNAAPNAN